MKKFVVLALMLISSISAFSQCFLESVYLKNGSVIKGDIVEFQPHKSVKVLSADGSFFVVDYQDIEKITREKVWHDVRPYEYIEEDVEQENASQFGLAPGYRGFVGLEAILGQYIGLNLSTVHGRQITNKVFLGGGVGVIFAENWDYDHYSLPVFANFRVDFVEKKISPFLDLRLGGDFAFYGDSGFYGDCSFGCRFKRSSISLGVQTIKDHSNIYHEETYYYKNPVTGIEEVRRWGSDYRDESRAFDFVARFSFEF